MLSGPRRSCYRRWPWKKGTLFGFLLSFFLCVGAMRFLSAWAGDYPIGFTAEGDPFQGDPKARVVLLEYGSFQCPFCARFVQEVLPRLRDQYVKTGKILYVFKDFPLSDANQDAQAAACAGAQSADFFWAMHDRLFAEQRNWLGQPDASDKFKSYATSLGLDRAAFDACLDSGQFAQSLLTEKQTAVGKGINTTPSFFVNDQPLVGFRPLDVVSGRIERALADASTASPGAIPAAQPPAPSFAQRVVELTNQERVRQGLPPLKANLELEQAALAHSQSMAERDFMGHENPATKSTPEDRIRDAGYAWSAVGENIAASQDTPEKVVAEWMNSPGHKANILSPDFREIGVGYTFDISDTYSPGGSPYRHYWTQNFGARRDVYPLIISNDALSTSTLSVPLFVYGKEWAKEMRLRNDKGDFTAWEPFSSSRFWQLDDSDGERRVTVELRDGANVVSVSDSIWLNRSTAAVPPIAAAPNTGATPASPAAAPTSPSRLQASDALTLDRRIEPAKVAFGEEVTAKFTLSRMQITCPKVVNRVSVDVVLVIDNSSSMSAVLGSAFSGTKLEGAKEAAKLFVDQVDLHSERVGVVQFSDSASLLQPLSPDAAAIKTTISAITIAGGTAIHAGLAQAHQELMGSHHRPEASRAIVLLTDGGSDPTAAQQAADAAKADEVRIVTIGLGAVVVEDLLRLLASSPEDYHYAPDTVQLADVYRSVAQTIQEYERVSQVTLTHTFDASNFELIPDSVAPVGQVGVGKITWTLDRLGAKPQDFTYRLRPRHPGSFNADRGNEVSFLRCEQSPPEGASLPSGLPVVVTAPPLPPEPPSEPWDFSLCGDIPWWLVVALLAILALLALVLFSDLFGARTWLRDRRRWPGWCQLIGLLTLAYTVFLLFMALNQFLPVVCRPREVLYFWRIQTNDDAAVMAKSIDPDRPVRSVKELRKQDRCVGCHAVSREGGRLAAVVGAEGHGTVFVMGLEGKPIPIPPIRASFLSWSPDGKKLAYSAEDKDVFILDVASGSIAALAGASDPHVVETMPSWSSDGQTIAFVRPARDTDSLRIKDLTKLDVPTDVYVVPAAGGTAVPLAGASGGGFNYYPAHSPDGKWLAFTRHTQGESTYADKLAEIFLLPASGGQPQRLAANDAPGGERLREAGNSWPTWSRDGRLLAFSSKRNGGQTDVFVTEIDPSGHSGPAQPLAEANHPVTSEHLPLWGVPPRPTIMSDLLGLWPWLLPLPLLVLLGRVLCQCVPPPPDTLRLERTASPDIGRLGRDEFSVLLRLVADNSLCREVRELKPVDVALMLDVSESMGEQLGASFAGSKLEGAKQAAKIFVSQLDFSQDRVAIIPFSEEAQVALPLTNDGRRIEEAISQLSVHGGTRLHLGLGVAMQALTGPLRRSDAETVIVLLSDGESEATPAEEVAAAARDAGVRVITIGLGASAGQVLLQSLASGPSDYYFSPDPGSLAGIYRSVAETIRQPAAATKIELEHSFDTEHFELIPGSAFPPPFEIGAGKLVWRLEHVGAVAARLQYRLKPLQAGDWQIDRGNRLDYLRCGHERRTIQVEGGLPVTVREPLLPSMPVPTPKPPPEPLEVRPPEVVWQPDKALVIGIGGTGRWVLTHLKKNLRDAGAGRLPEQVRMVVIDTAEHELINDRQVPVEFAGARIEPEDVLVLNENLGSVIARMMSDEQAEPDLQEWFPAEQYHALAEPQKNLARGTHGRRPLVRAGLVRDIQKGTDDGGSRLWQLLREAAAQVKGEHGIRVLIVGSLAGGMSGTLCDVAYLARRAARMAGDENLSVTIEAYLALDSVFTNVAADPLNLAANTFASLRELRRFQLNPGVAYPMPYRRDAEDTVLTGACSWRLFDDAFLFGEQLSAGVDPRLGVFPAMADLMTLRIDRASQGAGPADWNNEMRNAVGAYQQSHHELAVGTAGSFVYRLPAYDVMEDVKTRWARALVQAFLIGDDGGALRLDPALARDPGLTWEPADLAPLFLDGGVSSGRAERKPAGASALACLIAGQADERIDLGLREVEQQRLDAAREAFTAELAALLELILGGTEQAALNQSRAGKLGYALAFLDALIARLDEAETAVERLLNDGNADAHRKQQARKLQEARAVYRAVTEQSRAGLQQIARAISRTATRVPNGADGLYDALERHAVDLKEWRQQMDDIRVRRYVWTVRERTGHNAFTDRELADIWYLDYAKGARSPEQYVEYLTWETQADGTVALSLKVKTERASHRAVLRTVEDVPAFLDALLEMAGSVLQDAWRAHSLVEVMSSHGRLDTESAETAGSLRTMADPLLTLDTVRAGSASRRAVWCAVEQFQRAAERVRHELESQRSGTRTQAVEPLTTLLTTDRFACQLVRTVDAVPLDAIERMMQGMNNARDRYLSDDQRHVVFPAEAWAEEWERRRQVEDDRERLVLHPLVTAALAEPERARWYALALASGMLRQDGNRVALLVPGRAEQALVRVTPAGVDPLVRGFLEFTLQAPSSLVEAVVEHLAVPDDAVISRWQSLWVDAVPKEFLTGSEDRKDLGRLTRRMVRYELVQRFRQ